MITIETQTIGGEIVEINEQAFLKTAIAYLRKYSPDRVKIVAEEKFKDEMLTAEPAAVLMLVKNPESVVYFNSVIELEKTEAE